jgi:hypothetical protein
LFTNIQEKVSIHSLILEITTKTYYQKITYMDTNFDNFKEGLKFANDEKMIGNQKVKSLKIIKNTKVEAIVKVKVQNGYIISRFNHVNNVQANYIHIFDISKDKAFYAKREISKG